MQHKAIQLMEIEDCSQQIDLFDEILNYHSAENNFQRSNKASMDFTSQSSSPSLDNQRHFEVSKLQKATENLEIGCSCTKSMCLKNYCPCHRNGSKCNSACSCQGCKNVQFIPKRVKYVMGSIEHFTYMPFSL